MLDEEVIRRRIMHALEQRVLHDGNPELREYFTVVANMTTSPLGGVRQEEDGISGAADGEIEQAALLLCHHDADGDGLLSDNEFFHLIQLVASQTGETYSDDHLATAFMQADLDRSGFIDLNELLCLRHRQMRFEFFS